MSATNNPPEPIEAPFIGPSEKAAISGAVEVPKAQPVELADDGEAASQLSGWLKGP